MHQVVTDDVKVSKRFLHRFFKNISAGQLIFLKLIVFINC